MTPNELLLRDDGGIEAILDDLGRGIAQGALPASPVALIGVRSRGVPIADRLAGRIGPGTLVGAVDITLYRDDLDETSRWPVLLGTEIPFDVDGKDIVLVDDVLFTGRTARAAINAICDLGRPRRIRLLVLVDRGHRELPIRADLAGLRVETDRSENIKVRMKPLDPVDEIVRVPTGRSGGDRR